MYRAELLHQQPTHNRLQLVSCLMMIVFGLLCLFSPNLDAREIAVLSGAYLLLDAVLLMLPVFRRQTTPHLLPIILPRFVAQLVVAGLLIMFSLIWGRILGFGFVLLLLLWGGLDFNRVLEDRGPLNHQRLRAAAFAAISLFGALWLLANVIEGNFVYVRWLGVYLVVRGVTRLFSLPRFIHETQAADRYAASLVRQAMSVPIVPADQATRVPQPANPVVYPNTTRQRGRYGIDLSRYQNPMVLAPHPDDMEAFAGGLVACLPADVVSVVFCGGNLGVWSGDYEHTPPSEYVQVRLHEAAEAAQILGVTQIIYMGYLDRGLQCTEETIQQALKIIELQQPDLIVSFEFYKPLNPYSHPDHIATANIVRHAIARYAQRDSLTYMVGSTFSPNRFVDVTGIRHIKLEAVACHVTQFGVNVVAGPFLEKTLSKLWGLYHGVEYAEGFRLVNIEAMIKRLPPLDKPS